MLLMHKDIKVAKISNITYWAINEIISPEHMPVGTKGFLNNLQMTGKFLENWNKTRSIPKDRQNLNSIIKKLGCTVEEAKQKAKYVSLTDCYWIKDDFADIKWEDVNYHDNGFSDDLGRAEFIDNFSVADYNNPDLFTDGMLKKSWFNINGIPTLIKAGILGENCKNKHLLSANEVAASRIGKYLNMDVVDYSPIKIHNDILCSCPCFICNSNEEAVPLMQIEKDYNLYNKEFILKFFEKNNLIKSFSDQLLLNVLINNIDCHEKNIAVIRNPNTLDIIKMAPLYDLGSSFGFNNNISTASNNFLKPFHIKRRDTLSLVKNIEEIENISVLKDILKTTYEQFAIGEQMYEIAKTELFTGIQMVHEEVMQRQPVIYINNAEHQTKNVKEYIEEETER